MTTLLHCRRCIRRLPIPPLPINRCIPHINAQHNFCSQAKEEKQQQAFGPTYYDYNNSQTKDGNKQQSKAEETQKGQEGEEIEEESTEILAKEKLRQWTKFYHDTRSARWIKNHLALPFKAWIDKYGQMRWYQRIWAVRILRREGFNAMWKVFSIHHMVNVKTSKEYFQNKIQNNKRFKDYDSDDLKYFMYHKAPFGYFGNHLSSSTDPSKTQPGVNGYNENDLEGKEMIETNNDDDGDRPETHSQLINKSVKEVSNEKRDKHQDFGDVEIEHEDRLVQAINYVFEWETEDAYHDAMHPSLGKDVYGVLKERESKLRKRIKNNKEKQQERELQQQAENLNNGNMNENENVNLNDNTNINMNENEKVQNKTKSKNPMETAASRENPRKLGPPEGKSLNPYSALPEQNPRSANIMYGGRTLDQYVDFIYKDEIERYRNERKPIFYDEEGDQARLIATAKEKLKAITASFDQSPQVEMLEERAKVSETPNIGANVTTGTTTTTTTATAPPQQLAQSQAEDNLTTQNATDSDDGIVSRADTEQKNTVPAYKMDKDWENKISRISHFNRRTSFLWKGTEDERTPREVVEQVQKINVSAERADKDHEDHRLSDAEDAAIFHAREKIDTRLDINNRRYPWMKHGSAVFPESRQIRMNIGFMFTAAKYTLKSIWNDYKYVFKYGGGSELRQGIPPQISLMEFTALDQLYASKGYFGKDHSLFSDWTLLVDNKREKVDSSIGTANIIDDRLVMDGFLMHSSVEMGHRQRCSDKRHIGYVNLCSHEFQPEWDLKGFWSIGLKLRTDGRPYFLGLECYSKNRFMVFNGIIQLPRTPDGEWDYYEIPIHHFRPYSDGEFVMDERYFNIRWLRSIGIQTVGNVGPFHLEIQWIRAFREDARFDIEDEDEIFIQDVDALGLYERDIFKFHIIQHQYFQNDFQDPFRFEDDGVTDNKTYLGPPRAQREHFARMDPNLLEYIDLPDLLPLDETIGDDNENISDDARNKTLLLQEKLKHLEPEQMFYLSNYISEKHVGLSKSIMRTYKEDNELIANVTNELLYKQLEREYTTLGHPFFQIHKSQTKIPFIFTDITQTPDTPIKVLTLQRRKLLRELVPPHLRERDPGKYPQLV